MPRLKRRALFIALTILAAAIAIFVLVQTSAFADLWSRMLIEVQAVQRDLHRQLAVAMRAVQAEGATAAWTLVILSFVYGVFHAAGPGHGKVVISTYLLTQESQLRRGLILSLVASLAQGVTAIVLVFGTVGLFHLTMRQARDAATGLETVSYALVVLVGLILVASRGQRLWARHRHEPVHHDHQDGHADDAATHTDHGTSCSHNHAHGPSLSDLEKPLSWHGMAGMIASIGLRPCSGAILVLLVASSLNLYFAGIAAVAAMSIGTAITVALLATLSVYARKASLHLAELYPQRTNRLVTFVDVAGLLGGGIILLAGVLLFQASWTAPVHPLQ